ncbi:MAG: kynureninase [Actinobacteria bacterium]|nr:kynureninase [Actinomycetota bacterium]
MTGVSTDTREDHAVALDTASDAALRRDDFLIPPAVGGAFPLTAYFAGNSLGLQPRATRAELMADLDAWEEYGVHGHTDADRPWVSYHEQLRAPAARLVGAEPREVVIMNSLTVNLHLLLASFYRPTAIRHRIVIEDSAFPSDSYAVRSHVAFRGHDPETAVLRLRPRPGEDALRTEDIISTLNDHAHSIATVLLGGVNYLTGEVVDMPAITAAGHGIGATVGWDLAHAAGNIPLHLHDWDVDFAAWCSYKYLNAGPGALSGAFVHASHLGNPAIPRLEGWWSTDPASRFEMLPVSTPQLSADAWSVSNPPIFSMGPVRTSLEIFDAVGMDAIRSRSLRLTGYLRALLMTIADRCDMAIVTPEADDRHGAQLSVRVSTDVGDLVERMSSNWGVVADDRRPDIVRFAPASLYCTFHDCWRAADALSQELTGEGIA